MSVIAAQPFTDFYRDRRDRLYRALTLTLHDASLAREAVDEAMTRAYERWDEVAGYANPAGWVYRVAFNWAASRLRKTRREIGGVVPNPPAAEVEIPDPGVMQAIAGLTLDHRAVVVLRYYLDWPLADIAAGLDIPTGTVKSRLHRALDELERRLEREA